MLAVANTYSELPIMTATVIIKFLPPEIMKAKVKEGSLMLDR
jgi:hypothetical protein